MNTDAVRFPRIDHPTMLAAFREIAKTGLMFGIHNEDQELVAMLTEEAKAAGRTDPIMHAAPGRRWPRAWPTSRSSRWRSRPAAHVHIAHSSMARGFDLAAAFRNLEGAKTSGEACIQYLCMTEEDLVRLEGFGKCNPPFRSAEEVERVWQRLLAGKIAYVSTDHAPWPRERKLYRGTSSPPVPG